MRAGIWLIGARGSVATTSVVGGLALCAGLADPMGCVTATQAETAEAIVGDIMAFGERHDLDRVVVINVASTERLARCMPTRRSPPGARMWDFTPSTGARLPALTQLAAERGLPYAGNDGKTGRRC